jgi:ankyrin repeat protein
MDLVSFICAGVDLAGVKLLIEQGVVDVNQCVDWSGKTALFWAVNYDRFDICYLLIDSGADVNHSDKDGWTPLMYAVCCSTVRIVKLLLISGANFNHRNKLYVSALDYAVDKDKHYITQLLYWRGAKSHWNNATKKQNNIEGVLLFIYLGIIPCDLIREIHTKWNS